MTLGLVAGYAVGFAAGKIVARLGVRDSLLWPLATDPVEVRYAALVAQCSEAEDKRAR